MPTRSEAITGFLKHFARPDLAALYSKEMECQVNVGQDGGQRVDGEFKGRRWQAWSDGVQTWKSFRIPLHANTEPEDNDSEMKFDLVEHCEAIGMTGWNWKQKVSKWVAFDFDAITGHSDRHAKKLDDKDIQNVINAVTDIPWVTVRKSTGGKGLHLYILLSGIPTANHNEHGALARAILGRMTAITGFDFHSKVDICGGNMWVWHRKLKTAPDGLELIKTGTVLTDIPTNWRDHIKVVSGKTRKLLPSVIPESTAEDRLFAEITGQTSKIPLDEEHKKLIDYLDNNRCVWWWDQDHHILVTHTIHLKEAFDALGLKGVFKTNATGAERGADYNCFCHPNRRGSWIVRRFTQGVAEAETWEQDGAGWTRCYLNRDPDINIAARTFGGIEHPKGGYVFREGELAAKAALMIGADLKLPAWANGGRAVHLRSHKDGRLVAEVEKKDNDVLEGWLPEGKVFKKVFNTQTAPPSEPEVGNYDDLIRHLITEDGDDYGWMINRDGDWGLEKLNHINAVLTSLGIKSNEANIIIGQAVQKSWKLVNRPFEPEYLGNRQWNKFAAQFRFTPSINKDSLSFGSWTGILKHVGKNLDAAVAHHPWCKVNGILTGAEYLKCWLASLFQNPTEPLPYLFLYGPQNSGKSILHEAISLLVTRGYQRADNALISSSGFNAELEHAILAVVEETDLRKNKQAYNRIKDWVTSRLLPIHRKSETPYTVLNTTHWIQCSNNYDACPVFSGDTRITMIQVDDLDPLELVPKRILIQNLEKEAPDFLAELLNVELPVPCDRLAIPVIVTQDKLMTEDLNLSDLERFIKDRTYKVSGKKIKFSEFVTKFHEYIEPNQIAYWSKVRIGREINPTSYPKGRDMKDGAQLYVGNISWEPFKPGDPILPKYYVDTDGALRQERQ